MKLAPAKNGRGKASWTGPWADLYLIDADSSGSETEEPAALGSRDGGTSAKGNDKNGKGGRSGPKCPQG